MIRANTYAIHENDWDRRPSCHDRPVDEQAWTELPEALQTAIREERLYRLRARAAENAMLRDPATRACNTCAHFQPQPCCDGPSDDCGCRGLNKCSVGAFLSWRTNHEAYDPDGWWTATIDHRVYCPMWEAIW